MFAGLAPHKCVRQPPQLDLDKRDKLFKRCAVAITPGNQKRRYFVVGTHNYLKTRHPAAWFFNCGTAEILAENNPLLQIAEFFLRIFHDFEKKIINSIQIWCISK